MNKYKFRNLPCTIQPDDKLWCVSGQYKSMSGILEWCYDEEDAKYILSEMKKDKRTKNLTAHKFIQ